MRPLIAGNWKMNMQKDAGIALARDIDAYAQSVSNVDVVLCPPMSLLGLVGALPTTAACIGAQDIAAAPADHGAYTGDVSGAMIRDLGATYTIVGHSERRAMHHETDEVVAKKVTNAYAADLKVILCVGETLTQRESGSAEAIVTAQIAADLSADSTSNNTVIAYEPIWAIGTGKIPSMDEIAQMHAAIRAKLVALIGQDGNNVRILYGGSVKASNAGDILALANVNGALVGGASLKADDFKGIIQAGEKV